MRSSTCKTWLGRLTTLLVAFAVSSAIVFAQTKTVTGTVVDELGDPVIGANVIVVGTTNGATTDIDGNFSIQDVANNASLKVTYIGYKEQIIPVAGKNSFSIALAEDRDELDEVVVIGYGTVKKRDLTGAVASVSGDKLKANPVSNVAQALQGQLPGVSVTSQDGRPGASMSIRVRGGGSITQSNEPLFIVDGVQVSSIDDIPADNIESMDVLKDAASTAIYGARGANGVILITTKGGKSGKSTVRYGVYYQVKENPRLLDVLDAYDYVNWTWAYATAYGESYGDGVAQYFGLGSKYGNNLAAYRNVSSHNYVEDLMQTANSWNHDVSISGGNDKTKIYASLNYVTDEGIRIQSGFNRVNANLKVDQQINKKLSVDFDVRYSEINTEGTQFGYATSAYTYRPIDNPLGDGLATHFGNGSSSVEEAYSPLVMLDNYKANSNRQRLRAKTGLSWEVIKGLRLRSELSLGRNWSESKNWDGGANPSSQAYSSMRIARSSGYNVRWATTLNYEVPGLGKDNSLTILVGNEVLSNKTITLDDRGYEYKTGFDYYYGYGQFSTDSDLNTFANDVSIPTHTLSYFGRVNYSYKGRYLFTATFRADGTSKFPENNTWGYFPAAAAAWRISDEPWFEDSKDWLDNLKLRLSWGTSGADNVDSSLWKETWRTSNVTIDGKIYTAYVPGTMLANPDLKWETTTSRNAGIDFGFFNRFRGSFDFYWNTTDDNLMKVPTDTSSGYEYQMQNVASVSNKGIEVALGYDIIRTKDFNLNLNLTYNFNTNNVDEINKDAIASTHTGWGSSMRKPYYDYLVMEGEPVGLIEGYKSAGFYTIDDFTFTDGKYVLKSGIPDFGGSVVNYPDGMKALVPDGQTAFPGAAKFEDVNGDGVVDDSDETIIGHTMAKHTGGFTLSGNYKWIDFSAGFTYQIGGEIYNANAMHAMMGNKDNQLGENRLAIVADTWKPYNVNSNGDLYLVTDPGELASLNANAKYAVAYSEYGICSSEFIEDASYLRLNTLTVGYTFPQKLIRKIGISNCRIYFTGGNLFCISGYSGIDPDVNTNSDAGGDGFPTPNYDYNSYPKARTYTFGMNVTF